MSPLLPYAAAELIRVIAEAKACIRHGEPDLLPAMCRELLPWAGQDDVDQALGTILKLLLGHATTTSIAEIESEAFPINRLRKGWNPQGVSIAYLSWKYRQAFPPERDPHIAQVQALALTAQALWPHLDESTRLLHGLYVKLATVHGTLGHVESLRKLSDELLSGPLQHERQQTGLLRIIKQLQRLGTTLEIENILEQLLARSENNPLWVEATLTAVAALRALAKRLSDLQRLESLIGRMVESLKDAGYALCDKRLISALINCADFDRLHKLLPNMVANLDNVGVGSTLLSVLDQLLSYGVHQEIGDYIARVYRQDPGDPMAVLIFAKFLAQQGMSHTDIAALFAVVRRDTPQHDKAILWIATLYYKLGEYDQVTSWLDAHPLNEPEKSRSLLNRVRAATDRPSLPYTVDTADGERINLNALGSLGPLLKPLAEVLNGDLSYRNQSSLAGLSSDLSGVILAIKSAMEGDSNVVPFDFLNAARELTRAATFHLRDMVIQQRASPIVLGPQYGVLDIARIVELFKTMHRAAIMLSQYGIEAALRGAPLADVRHLCQLAEIRIQSELALGETQTSEEVFQALRIQQVCPGFVQRLLERCALNRGDVRAAETIVAGQSEMCGEIFSLVPFNTWARLEAVGSETLVHPEPWEGTFEYLDSQGILHQAQHEVPATQVDLLHVQRLRVRDTEILIGSKGSIPRPHPWHFRDAYGYGYPRPSSICLNRGQGGCRLRVSEEREHITEPVVALVNMDGPYWRNYFHWMILILTRVSLLIDQGVFEHRRFLVPVELSGWMMASLAMVGLPEERMLRYTAKQEVLVDDAMVVGPVEFAAAPLVKSLQRRLWAASDVDPAGGESGPPVWLSRRHQPRRYLANSDSIEALARQHGFIVASPESLGLIDQVRLCAYATAIAGPDGACLTNFMFARPGTRVLGLVPESNNYPTFIDLCAVANLHQRWIFGRTDPRKSWWGGYHQPFEVDMAVLERELQWLVGNRS
jgi:hypothetical protein